MRRIETQSGFSLLELLVAMAILLVISAAVFGLLNATQIRYRNEQQFLDSFQNARVGLEQLGREIHNAGFPAANTYTNVPTDPLTALPDLQRRFAIPFRGYDAAFLPNMGCTVNGNCGVPGANELSMEMDLDPYNINCVNRVEIVEYKLQPDGNGTTSTLMRSVSSKPGAAAAPSPPCLPGWTGWATNTWVPFIENVVNAFPGPNNIRQMPANTLVATPIPIFTYVCDATPCAPQNVKTIFINLWVRSQNADLQTNQIRTINLQGAAERLNPDQ